MNISKLKLIILFLLSALVSFCGKNTGEKHPRRSFIPTSKQLKIIDSIQFRSFKYFVEQTNPANGLVKDRSTGSSPASIAAAGFALPVYAVGVQHGWISKKDAADKTIKLFKFLLDSEQSNNPDATGYRGFYYHFLKMSDGKREWNSELSTIDTGLLLAGIIFARNYYSGDNPSEEYLRRMADSLIGRVDWDFFTLSDSGKYANTLSLGWSPEKGFEPIGWVGYNEALIMYIIAAGMQMKDVDKAYNRWLSFYDWRNPYPDIKFVSFPPLFGHQFSHIFIDFRNIADDYMRKKNLDYFKNSQLAVEVQRRYAIENPLGWKGYDSLTWGLTACDGPGPDYNYDDKVFYWYTARGTSGPDLIQNDDGTIAPTAAASSIAFAPQIVIPTIMNFYDKYGKKGLWGRYGFYDAFNPTVNWFDKDYIAIDQAPIVLMIENWRNGFVWNYVMMDKIIKTGLERLGFKTVN